MKLDERARVALLLVVAVWVASASPSVADGVKGKLGVGQVTMVGTTSESGSTNGSSVRNEGASAPTPPRQTTVSCVPPPAVGSDLAQWCSAAAGSCRAGLVMLTVSNNFLANEPLVSASCNGVAVGPVVTQAAVREVVSRLVPSPAVGTPWPWSVVNFPVLLWLDTAADRVLPPVSVVGVPVRVRIRVASVAWDFGDGDSASTADPGIAYDPARPCGDCAGRFGHVFRRAGVVRVSAVASWSVQFATTGQGWTDLEGTVSGPVSGVAIRLREAHSVLLPDPGH